MTQLGLFVELKAKPGKEEEVAAFLAGARALVREETGTVAWFALRFDAGTFGIFDAFDDAEGRDAHLTGAVASALMQRAGELFSVAPQIRRVEVLTDLLR
jgi:quinol monooxygenase YgiN